MSATAVSSLNPDAPLFIPAAFRQVEDFSPQWWDLVKTTAWFRDHWFHEHQQLDEMADSLALHDAADDDDDLAGLLPDDAFDDDDDDLFFDQTHNLLVDPPQPPAALKTVKFIAMSPMCVCRCGAQGAEPGVSQGRRRTAGAPGEAPALREAHQVRRQPEERRRAPQRHPPASLGCDG
uniref:Ataxin-2 C-terminal domain-containing protein n=1 Tax=Oryza glaberrima TaxID=4538 RepID=I1PBC7_ORYGL